MQRTHPWSPQCQEPPACCQDNIQIDPQWPRARCFWGLCSGLRGRLVGVTSEVDSRQDRPQHWPQHNCDELWQNTVGGAWRLSL